MVKFYHSRFATTDIFTHIYDWLAESLGGISHVGEGRSGLGHTLSKWNWKLGIEPIPCWADFAPASPHLCDRAYVNDVCWRLGVTCWWHEMDAFSALLVLCVGNPLATSGFPSQWPVTRSFDIICENAPEQMVDKKIETSVIWDTITLIMMSL